MIGPQLADPIRLALAVLSLTTVLAGCYAVRYAPRWDLRIVFGFEVIVGLLLVLGYLAGLGTPAPWRLPAFAVVLPPLLWATISYARRKRRELERGPGEPE